MIAPDSPAAPRRFPVFALILSILGSLVLLLVIAPLLGLVLGTSLSELGEAAVDREVTRSVRLTLSAALAATAMCTLFGIPLAYLLARKRFRGRAAILAIVDLPLVIPHSVAGIALLTVIGRDTLLQSGFGDFIGSFQGIVVAMAFVSVPFLIHAARSGFESVPVRLEHAARSLGAGPARVFFTIALPMAWREILSGMVLMWARGISEFGAVMIIAYHPMTTPVLVFKRFNDYGLSYARSASVVLLVICGAIFVALRFLSTRRGNGTRRA